MRWEEDRGEVVSEREAKRVERLRCDVSVRQAAARQAAASARLAAAL